MFWLGGYRNYAAPYKKQSSWIWSDGAEMNFTAWAPGQPNNFWSDRVDNQRKGPYKVFLLLSLMTFALVSKFHVYLPWVNAL